MKNTYKAKAVTDFRKELDLEDTGNPMFEGQHSPTLVLALFSELFGQRQPDWPPQTEITGFCFYDGNHNVEIPIELTRFLDNGAPPIVFTLGSSAVWVARDFFQESIKAAKGVGRRCAVDHDEQPATRSPRGIIALDYVPYQTLLPRACAVVHTVAATLRTWPARGSSRTMIVPFAFDQSDNADTLARSEPVGLSIAISTSRRESRTSCTSCSNSRRTRAVRMEVSQRLKQENGWRGRGSHRAGPEWNA